MRPPRPPFVLSAALIAVALAGCENKPEPRRAAQTAVAGLMPAGQPGYDEGYVIDQAQVKTAPARKVSYEPFESFRKKSGAAASKPDPATNEPDPDTNLKTGKPKPPTARPAVSQQMPPGAVGGFWQRVGMKTLAGAMGGPPPAGATQPPAATEEAASDDDSASDDSEESKTDEESSDEDESEDGSDDGEASNDDSEEEEESDDDGD